MGMLHDRSQLKESYAAIKNLHETHPVLLLMFVHGWKHSASPGDSNLVSFFSFVTNMAAVPMKNAYGKDYAVVGVYFGWRGNIFDFDRENLGPVFPFSVATLLGYYNRDAAAKRVGGISATEAMMSLAGAAKTRSLQSLTTWNDEPETFFGTNNAPQLPPDPLESRVVIAGHSMGGLIVERAFAQALIGHMAITDAQYQSAKAFTEDPVLGVAAARTTYHEASKAYTNAQNELKSFQAEAKRIEDLITEINQDLDKWQKLSDEGVTASENLQKSLNVIHEAIGVLNQTRAGLGLSQLRESDYLTQPTHSTDLWERLNGLCDDLTTLKKQCDFTFQLGELAIGFKQASESLSSFRDSYGMMATNSDISWGNSRNTFRSSLVTQLRALQDATNNHITLWRVLGTPDFPGLKSEAQRQTAKLDSATNFTVKLITTLTNYQRILSNQITPLVRKMVDAASTNSLSTAPGLKGSLEKLNAYRDPEDSSSGLLEKQRSALDTLLKAHKNQIAARDQAISLLSTNGCGVVNTPEQGKQCCDKIKDGQCKKLKAQNAKVAEALTNYHNAGVALRNLASACFVRSLMEESTPADLILLINPACSALSAKQLDDALANAAINLRLPTPGTNANYHFNLPGNKPLIINITSRKDIATGLIFPIAHLISSFTKTFPGSSGGELGPEARLYRHTDAHLPDRVTHAIRFDTELYPSWTNRAKVYGADGIPSSQKNAYYVQLNSAPTNGWIDRDFCLHEIGGNKIITPKGIYSITNSGPATEYWTVDCAPELLPDHSQFWTPEFYATMSSLIRIRRLYDYSGKRIMNDCTNATPPAPVPLASQP
jgi:hypothetical protein